MRALAYTLTQNNSFTNRPRGASLVSRLRAQAQTTRANAPKRIIHAEHQHHFMHKNPIHTRTCSQRERAARAFLASAVAVTAAAAARFAHVQSVHHIPTTYNLWLGGMLCVLQHRRIHTLCVHIKCGIYRVYCVGVAYESSAHGARARTTTRVQLGKNMRGAYHACHVHSSHRRRRGHRCCCCCHVVSGCEVYYCTRSLCCAQQDTRTQIKPL